MSPYLFRSTLIASLLFAIPMSAGADNTSWDDQFGYAGVDPNAPVLDIALDGTDVYIAGAFKSVTNVPAYRIARWDGTAWHGLQTGVSGVVRSMCFVGPLLYVAGNFANAAGTTVNNVAAWDGSSWSALGSGVSASGLTLFAVEAFDGDIYVSGAADAGGFLSRWDGTSWTDMSGAFSPGDSLHALTSDGAYLYVGGDFTTADGVPANAVARWDGATWSAMGTGFGFGRVLTLDSDGVTVYAGGQIKIPSYPPFPLLGQWDGASWTGVGTGVSASSGEAVVNDVYTDGSRLFVAGYFDHAGGNPADQVAVWDGVSWSGNTSGAVSYSGATAVAGNPSDVYVGASSALYEDIAGSGAKGIARWDGTVWHRMSNVPTNGMGFYVNALALAGNGDVIAGGSFTQAGEVSANHLATFDGTTWTELGGGVDGQVDVLLADGTTTYVGGNFTHAGATAVSHVAAWDGSAWDDLGGGVTGGVYALAMYGGDLVAGGNCSGCPLGHVKRWDGVGWNSLATVSDASYLIVFALHVHDGDLYIGGGFGAVDGVPASNVARWDGTSWSAMGDGFDTNVYALATFAGDLYAGGTFRHSGAAAVNAIARWDGAQWVEVGGGAWPIPNGHVRTLQAFGPSLYVGGDFSYVGPTLESVYGIARWDGYGWYALGGGTWDGSFPGVDAILGTPDALWVGGSFTRAGGKHSRYIGRYTEVPTGIAQGGAAGLPTRLEQNVPNPFNPGTTIRYTISKSGPVQLRIYDVQGRLVRTLVDEMQAPRHYDVTWDGTDSGGQRVASGVYFYRLNTAGRSASRRMVLLK